MTATYHEILANAIKAVKQSDAKYVLLQSGIAAFSHELKHSVAGELKTGMYVNGEFKEGDVRRASNSSYDFEVTAKVAEGKHAAILLTAKLNMSVSTTRGVFEIIDRATNESVSVPIREDMSGAFRSATQVVINSFARDLSGAIQEL